MQRARFDFAASTAWYTYKLQRAEKRRKYFAAAALQDHAAWTAQPRRQRRVDGELAESLNHFGRRLKQMHSNAGWPGPAENGRRKAKLSYRLDLGIQDHRDPQLPHQLERRFPVSLSQRELQNPREERLNAALHLRAIPQALLCTACHSVREPVDAQR